MPRVIVFALLILILMLLLPPAIIARVRSTPGPNQPIRIIQDMAFQSKFKPQSINPLYADKRSMRAEVPGTIAVDKTYTDTFLYEGVTDSGGKTAWATTTPPSQPMTEAFLLRGQDRFNIYCSACHGFSGAGDGMVNRRAMELVSNINGPVNETQWVQAKNLIHDETITVQPVGQIFNTITHGIRTMAGYAAQIPTEDRWAIACYVKALQRSQNAKPEDLPQEMRSGSN